MLGHGLRNDQIKNKVVAKIHGDDTLYRRRLQVRVRRSIQKQALFRKKGQQRSTDVPAGHSKDTGGDAKVDHDYGEHNRSFRFGDLDCGTMQISLCLITYLFSLNCAASST